MTPKEILAWAIAHDRTDCNCCNPGILGPCFGCQHSALRAEVLRLREESLKDELEMLSLTAEVDRLRAALEAISQSEYAGEGAVYAREALEGKYP